MDRHLVPPPPSISSIGNLPYVRGGGIMTSSYPPPTLQIQQQQQQNKENPYPADALIDYRLQQNQFLGARFIFECGKSI